MRRSLFVPSIVCAAVLTLLMASGAIAQGEAVPDGKESCCRYVGDINHDGASCGVPNITDLVYMVTYMFQDGPCDAMCEETGVEDCGKWELGPCFPETDINGDGTCIPDIQDLVWLVTYIGLNSGPAPVGWIDEYTPACVR